jgi:ATP-dependent RNA helicase RhlE
LNTFASLQLIDPLKEAVAAQNYEHPTPIQAQAIPALLDGLDVIGCAQTGTGKTAAFALPVLQHLSMRPRKTRQRFIRALILSPTRELAAQIGESFEVYGKYLELRHTVIFGGVNERSQIAALDKGVDIVVATPGRLLDLQGRDHIDLSQVEFFVLDEADRMLDMGFLPDIRRVLKQLPAQRQNLLFSATMPPAVTELAHTFLRNPVRVEVTPESSTVEAIEQEVMFVDKNDKPKLLVDLLVDRKVGQAIVFTRTKHGANRLCQKLEKSGFSASAIHGNKSQNARQRALDSFKAGETRILVATDLASRGLDVDDVTHVFNFDLPNEPESYVHRIGRTGRAGRSGFSISFCDESEGSYLRAIEKIIGEKIPVASDQPYHLAAAIPPEAPSRAARPGGHGGGNGSAGNGSAGNGSAGNGNRNRRRRRR